MDLSLKELNFGGIGFSIGHELSHGFDDNGRKYDGDGNLEDWWGEEALAGFKEKTLCLENQFGNYTLYNTSVKSRLKDNYIKFFNMVYQDIRNILYGS